MELVLLHQDVHDDRCGDRELILLYQLAYRIDRRLYLVLNHVDTIQANVVMNQYDDKEYLYHDSRRYNNNSSNNINNSREYDEEYSLYHDNNWYDNNNNNINHKERTLYGDDDDNTIAILQQYEEECYLYIDDDNIAIMQQYKEEYYSIYINNLYIDDRCWYSTTTNDGELISILIILVRLLYRVERMYEANV